MMLTCKQMITELNQMDNGERIGFLKYLRENHFHINPLTKEERRIIDDLRDGYVKVVEADEI